MGKYRDVCWRAGGEGRGVVPRGGGVVPCAAPRRLRASSAGTRRAAFCGAVARRALGLRAAALGAGREGPAQGRQ